MHRILAWQLLRLRRMQRLPLRPVFAGLCADFDGFAEGQPIPRLLS